MPPPGPTSDSVDRASHARQSEQEKAATPGPKPALLPKCPEPPSFLSPYACDEWWRVAPELWALGLLTVLDTGCLAAYCQTYVRWREAEEALARVADRDEQMRGLLMRSSAWAQEAQDGNRIFPVCI